MQNLYFNTFLNHIFLIINIVINFLLKISQKHFIFLFFFYFPPSFSKYFSNNKYFYNYVTNLFTYWYKSTLLLNLYSRQIGTFGMEAMGKLIKMNVLIVGLRGLGVETAKNLILAGPKSVTLFDPTPVTWGDLSSNFYCKEEHVGKTSRADASFEKLQELNPYVKVNVVSSLTLEDHANFHVVAYTEISGTALPGEGKET